MTTKIWCSVLAMAWIAGCGPAVAPDGVFATGVHPILEARCGTCHQAGGDSNPYEGPGDFGDADVDVAFSAAQEYVEAGDAEASTLYIRVAGDMPTMPPAPGEPLPPDERAALMDWIEAGAPPD